MFNLLDKNKRLVDLAKKISVGKQFEEILPTKKE